MKKRKARVAVFFILSSIPLLSHANKPVSTPSLMEDTATFLRNGERTALPLAVIGEQVYLGIDQIARMAQAQLRWQAVTQQACLSNVQGLLCFNWDDSRVYKDGRASRKTVPIKFDNNQLFIPMKYVTSKEFESFSRSDISWNPQSKQLAQMSPINLRIPTVEKLSDRYQLRLETAGDTPHYLIEKTPKRIWVRFVKANSEGSQILEGDNVIREVRINQKRHSADLIVNLGDDAESHDIYFDEGKKNLIVDVFTSPQITKSPEKKIASIPVRSTAAPQPVSVPVSAPVPVEKPAPVRWAPAGERKGVRTIVIDAGHGGMDAGAIGARGTMEKDINLEVAKALAKLLRKEKNVEVILTREKDVFIPLSQRTAAANAVNADVFVSIHCNSSLSPKGNGFETYFLSPDATDKAAEAVARLENSVVTLEAKKGAASSRLEEMLASMAVHNHINDSSRLAGIVCRTIKNKTPLDKTAVKEADFYVLRGAQMPAVLIELEYLSNPVSEIKLRSSRFRAQLIKGIADGILTFDKQLRQENEAITAQLEKPLNKTQR